MHRSDLGWVGAITVMIAGIYYIHDIFRNTDTGNQTQPHPISWIIWTVIGVLGVSVSIKSGVGAGVYVSIVYLILQLIIALLSLTKKFGKWSGVTRVDYVLGALALLIILLWQLASLSDNKVAVLIIITDAIASWGTVREAWRQPQSESARAWSTSAIGAIIGIMAVQSTSLSAVAYPIYLTILVSTLAAIIIFRDIRLNKPFV
ncbi:MAG TPA: hypothetical protein VFB03_01310 [Candidatus Saccharimonadales bacterium]|nr:hypothetical protein [Candidatus Saccharimonadales bacterium]